VDKHVHPIHVDPFLKEFLDILWYFTIALFSCLTICQYVRNFARRDIMSVVIPFKALRPHRQFVQAVASCPYDVVNVEEARNIVRNNPLSFLHVEKSEIDLLPIIDVQNDHVYEIAKSNMENLIQTDIVFREKTPCFYIYRQKMDTHEQYGIVARVSLAEYESGRIKKHEFTRMDKEIDRIKHVAAVDAHTGLVFLTYKARRPIDAIVEKKIMDQPEYDFTADDGITHTAWIISDEENIEALVKAFAEIDNLYIADGHHRAAAAAAVGKMKKDRNPDETGDEAYHYMMAALFPHNQLNIMDYNRVVRDLHGLDIPGFIRKVSEKFMVSDDFKKKAPRQCHEFGLYLQGRWFKLTAKDGTFNGHDPVEVLDVSILQNNLLDPVLGIQDPRADDRIEFVGGIRGMKELERLVDSGDFVVAFSLYPTTLTQLMAVADVGRVMPPKSTWFEPKLRSGIFIHPLTNDEGRKI
jgi:uncharacterized protein (DUF1015 family)